VVRTSGSAPAVAAMRWPMLIASAALAIAPKGALARVDEAKAERGAQGSLAMGQLVEAVGLQERKLSKVKNYPSCVAHC
jgi:hypothetical protein